MVIDFLERNADPIFKSPKDNWDALDWCCSIGYKNILELLIKKVKEN